MQNMQLLLLCHALQHLERFQYEGIIKWLPADQRTTTKGTPDCLDAQIKTTQGPRELRLRASGPESVQLMLRQLNSAVQRVVESRQQVREGAAGRRHPGILCLRRQGLQRLQGCSWCCGTFMQPCRRRWSPCSSSSKERCTDNQGGAEDSLHEQHNHMCCRPEAGRRSEGCLLWHCPQSPTYDTGC